MQRTLLVPLDGSEVSEASLPWAVTLARARGQSLTLVRVTDYPRLVSEEWLPGTTTTNVYDRVLAADRAEAVRYLETVRSRLADTGLTVDVVNSSGNPSVALLDLADELGAEAIVIATHGRGGFKRLVLGSVAMQLVSHASVPVFLVRACAPELRREAALGRLLVPLDGSILASRALEIAQDVALPGATLVLVRVVPWRQGVLGNGEAERQLDVEAAAYGVTQAGSYLRRIAAPLREAGFSVETQVVESESTATISRHLAVAADVWNVDAIVMSTHGHGGVTGWLLGSVADEVARSADRPVLLVSPRVLAARTTHQLRVGDVMTRDVMAVREDESLLVALRRLARRPATGTPVVEGDGRVVGVVSQRDILAWHERTVDALARLSVPAPEEYRRRLQSEQVRSVMTTPPTTVEETATLASALALLQARGVHRLPVTRDERLVGILTGSDILLALYGQLEPDASGDQRADLQPTSEAHASVNVARNTCAGH
jgi:nucleotide-binding universal stress UspA family protein/CBS domain-containing protein